MLVDSPLLLAVVAVGLLLVSIIYFKLHAFVALLLISFLTAFLGGIATENIVPTMLQGFGSTLASVALLVGLGAMIGKVLDASGGAQTLADSLIRLFGEKHAPLALGIASLLFGFPIFFDAGLIVMLPIILSVAHRLKGHILVFALPAAGAFAVMHALVPPHPGPVAAAELLGADIGWLIFWGIVVALPSWYFGSFLFASKVAKRHTLEFPAIFLNVTHEGHAAPPKTRVVLGILLLPLVLIFLNTGLNTYLVANDINEPSQVIRTLMLLGNTPVALLITLIATLLLFKQRYTNKELQQFCEEALAPICAIILVTGAGGMFGGVLRATGIGDALSNQLTSIGVPTLVAAFLIAAGIRVAQGSATVALTTTAALIAPAVAANSALSGFDICFIVISIAGGASVLSHFNDSGFWLVGRLFNMDEKTTLQTWTPMVTLIGTLAFLFAWGLSVIF